MKNGYALIEKNGNLSLFLSIVDFKDKCKEIKIIDKSKLIFKGDSEYLITNLTSNELGMINKCSYIVYLFVLDERMEKTVDTKKMKIKII